MSICPCPVILDDCIGVDSPIVGVSSLAVDRCYYYASCSPRANSYAPPPLGGGIATLSCDYTVLAAETQAEADSLAAAACVPGPAPEPQPCIVPSKAINPFPADGAMGIDPSHVVVSWADGGDSTNATISYDVYLNEEFVASQVGATYDLGALTNCVSYTWRIDSVNFCGKTTGDIWAFSTSGCGVGCVPISETIPTGTVGSPYSHSLASAFGIAPRTFATADLLPDGLTLDASGLISGTPTTPGTTSFVVTVTDALGAECTDNVTVEIVGTVDLALIAGAAISNAFGGHFTVELSGPVSGSTSGDAANGFQCYYAALPEISVFDGAVYTIEVQAITGDPSGWLTSCIGFNDSPGYSIEVSPGLNIEHSPGIAPGSDPDVFTITFHRIP